MSHEDPAVETSDVDGMETRSEPGDDVARYVVAHGRVTMLAATTADVASNTLKKGDVLATARYAGIQAAKQTASLVAEADVVTLINATIHFEVGETWIDIEARVDGAERVDVEAHALSAVTVAALTIYDMCKSVDRTMMIGAVGLLETSGGRFGSWRREEDVQNNGI